MGRIANYPFEFCSHCIKVFRNITQTLICKLRSLFEKTELITYKTINKLSSTEIHWNSWSLDRYIQYKYP